LGLSQDKVYANASMSDAGFHSQEFMCVVDGSLDTSKMSW